MATQNTVKIGVDVSDNGTAKKTIKNVEELHSTIKKTQATANKGISIGGTQGSRSVAAGYKPSAAAAAAQPTGSAEIAQYGQLRGSAGVTGASARDFANQAQGLGGLVRLYATYAANIFAVGAAFRALSSAMDTTNMVKGLDQLGAASGTALGSLSKSFVQATEGAVSLREAMEAVTKASSSGLANKDILRIATSAKQASQALGVDMSDAVSRLTRGITKLEPELLDELGIFVRVDTAVSEYAKSVGKSANSLTDFERRMAFANATLDQAEKKFGVIKIDTNPYTQLLASVKDASQSVLELVNVAIAPLVKLLASSPTALLTVLGGISVILLKQALPALGEFRAGLRASAEQALETAKVFKESFSDEFQARLEQRFRIPDIEKQIKKAETDLASMKFTAKIPASVAGLAKGDESNLAKVNSVLKTRNDIIETGMKGTKKASEAQISAAKEEIAYIQKVIQLNTLRQQKQEALGAAQEQADKPLSRFDPEIIAAKKYQDLQTKVASSAAVFNASQNAQITGIRGAWQLLNKEVADNGIKGISKYTTLAQGGLAAVGSRLVGLIGAFGQVGMIVGAAIAGFGILNSWLTKTAEETKATETSLEALDGSYKNLNNTIDNIRSKDPLQAFSVQSISARATALSELTESTKTFVDNSFKELQKMGAWDLSINWVKSLWGGDIETALSNRISSSLVKVFRNIEEGSAAGKAAKESIEKILNVRDLTSFDQVDLALSKLSSKDRKAAIEQISVALKRLGDEARISAAKGTELNASLSTLSDIRKKIITGFTPKDEMSQFGTALLDVFSKVSVALEDPVQRLNAIKSLSKEILEVPGTTLSEALGLQKAAKQVEDLEKATVSYNKTREESARIEAEIANLIGMDKARKVAEGRQVQISGLTSEGIQSFKQLKKELLEVQKLGEIKLKVKTELSTEVAKNIDIVNEGQLRIFKAGTKLITDGLSAEWAKAGATIANAYASVLSGTETGIKMRAASDRAVVNAQIAQIESQRSLTIATRELALQIQEKELEDLKQNSSGKLDMQIVAQKDRELQRARADLAAAKAGDTKGLAAKLSDEITTAGTKLSETKVQGFEFAQSMEASGAAIANLRAQIAAINIGEKFQLFDEQTKAQVEGLQNSLKSLEIEKESASVIKQINGEYSKEYISAKQSVEQKILAKQQEIERFNLLREIEKYEKAGATLEVSKAKVRLSQLDARQKETTSLQATNQLLERIDTQYKKQIQDLDRISKLDSIRLSGTNALKDAERDVADIALNTADQTQQFTKEYIAQKQYELSIAKSIEEQKRAEDAATYNARITQLRLAAEYEAEMARTGGVASAAGNYILDQMAAEAAAYGNIVTALNQKTNAQNAATTSLKQYNDEQVRFANLLESLKGLDVIFEGLGTKLSEVATAFKTATDTQSQYAKTIADMEFERDAASTAKEKIDWQEKIDKAMADSRKAELNSASKLAGATKNLFKEKTAAYKAFAATEKVLQAASLALEVKTVLTKMGLWAAEVPAKAAAETAMVGIEQTAAAAKAPTTFGEIVGNYLKNIPAPWGMVAGLTAGAFFLSLLGGGGGGKAGPTAFTPTSAQIQETQGTGMTWSAAGEKVADVGGILGDDEAKANSIVNSLEILKDNSFKSLDYDNKLLRSFQNLADALATTTNTILTSGLRTIPASIIQTLGSRTEAGFGADIPIIGGILSGIFGGGYSESRNIQSQRLELRGTFNNLADDMASGLRQVTDILVQWQEDGGWFGSDDSGSYIESIVGTVPEDVINSFESVFKYLREGYQEISQQLKKEDPITFVASKLQNLMLVDSQGNPLKFDYTGLKGDEIKTELEAYFSKINNIALKYLFPEFSKFETAGEDYGTTVIKVIQNTNQVRLALMSMGSAFDLTRSYLLQTVETSYDIAAALTKAAGGLENFVDQVNFFSQNFLTEAERLAPIQKAVVEELTRLGYSSITTRNQFKQLVQGLDLSTEAGRQNYQSLMDLAEGFSLVTEATETALNATIDKFKKFAEDLKSFRDNLVLGSSSILTPLQKYAEAKLQFEDTYTKALAGDEKAQSKLTGSAQAFLTASKDYFASSSAYTQDFNSVLDKVGVGITGAEEQISIAEMQLNGITTQVGLLTQINENIAYIAGVPQAATGGRVGGLTFVGERGPELVDFTSPARVYTAEQTAGMFAPQPSVSTNMTQVVMELKQVKQELSQLRKEQQQQTGDLIVSNYDANNKAAQSIAQEVTNINTNAEWQQRNKVVVV